MVENCTAALKIKNHAQAREAGPVCDYVGKNRLYTTSCRPTKIRNNLAFLRKNIPKSIDKTYIHRV